MDEPSPPPPPPEPAAQVPPLAAAAPPPAAPWSFPARLAFRAGFIFAAMLLFPFPIGYLPKTQWLVEYLAKPFEWEVSWVATAVLGLPEPSTQQTGSGDSTAAYVFHLVALAHALVGAAIWSALDRRRTDYRRLASAAIVVLRFYLGLVLISYAIAKLYQFPPPDAVRLDRRVGDMSPMGMLWTFMGSSQPYSLFGGAAEALGGVLLLWRRTSVAGALVAAATMTNVVMLNLCYDVPVKLFSIQLLLIAAVILLPHARRLIAAVLGRATAEVPPRPRRSPRAERARIAVKTLFLLAAAAHYAMDFVEVREQVDVPSHELEGIWVVDRLALDGVEVPPLATDPDRWHKLLLSEWGGAIRPMTGDRVWFRAKVDPAARTLELDGKLKGTWTYTLGGTPDAPKVTVEGTYKERRFRAEATREPPPLLVTRGFHWINEVPYNR